MARHRRAGVEVLENRPLRKTFVSRTTRSRAIVGEELREPCRRESRPDRLGGDVVAQSQERSDVGRARRHSHSMVAGGLLLMS